MMLRAQGSICTAYMLILLVPVVWGTYSPLIKHLFSTVKYPPPPLLFNTMSFTVSFTVMIIAGSLSSYSARDSSIIRYVPTWRYQYQRYLMSGIELGCWLFAGSLCYIIGIHATIPASRAAILVQQTTIIVPLLDSIGMKRWPSYGVVFSCFLAVIGTILIVLERPFDSVFGAGRYESGDSGGGDSHHGDMLVLCAAMFYSMHIFRLGYISSHYTADCVIPLAAVKSATQMILSLFLLIIVVTFSSTQRQESYLFLRSCYGAVLALEPHVPISGQSGKSVSDTYEDVAFVAGCIVWNGAVAVGFSMWAQAYAQRLISPVQATIIYAMQPMWACLFSMLFLREVLSFCSCIGVSFVMLAVAMVTCFDTRQQNLWHRNREATMFSPQPDL